MTNSKKLRNKEKNSSVHPESIWTLESHLKMYECH